MYLTMSNLVAHQAAWNLNATNARLGESILKLSSGLRVQGPEDGAYEFIKGSSLASSIRINQDIKNGISEVKGILGIAGSAASEIRTKLESMLEKANTAATSTDAATISSLSTEFSELRTSIDNIVKGTKYQGGNILMSTGQYNQPFSVTINEDHTYSMAIDLNSLDVSLPPGAGIAVRDGWGVDAGTAQLAANDIYDAMNPTDGALAKVDTLVSQISGYDSSLTSQMNISDSTIQNYQAVRSTFVEVDVADEMANFTALDVQKQAGQAMLAQANLSQRSILKLYEWSFS